MNTYYGWVGKSNKKADKGTIVHKVLEIMALAKQGKQNGERLVDDDIAGFVKVDDYDIDNIVELVYKYYSEAFEHHDWDEKDLKECRKWVWKALEFNNGAFDPRNLDIVEPELRFDITIDKPWAAFEYTLPDKTQLKGQLALKGTVDLTIKENDTTYEIIDWKTGRRLNWATGEEKTYEHLKKDKQLRMYHYALHQVYPELEQVVVTIFYINDGGPFSICFTNDDLKETEEMLRKEFETVKSTDIPQLNQSWKCRKFCHQGTTTFEDTEITPIKEFRWGQVTRKGQYMSKCEQIRFELQRKGPERVLEEYKNPEHVIGKYHAPGDT